MEKIKVILIVCFIQMLWLETFKVSAQQYYKLVDTNKLWSIQHKTVGTLHDISYSYYIKFNKDTTIKSILYKKVMLSRDSLHLKWINDGYIRETSDKKVFYLPNINSVEVYLYNFNVKKGDTNILNEPGGSFTVVSIDNIMIGKQLRKRFYLNNQEIWIEGIGSLCGILNVGMCAKLGGQNSLLCFTENDTLKYKNLIYNYCYIRDYTPYSVSGKVTYDNVYNTPIINSKFYALDQEGIVKDSTTTDSLGTYNLKKFIDGNYSIKIKPLQKLGGVDPADALLVNRYYINSYKFSDALRKTAADVNNDGRINPADALFINRRYVNIFNTFKAGDWILNTNKITVNGSDQNIDLKVICTGDVNGSYIPK